MRQLTENLRTISAISFFAAYLAWRVSKIIHSSRLIEKLLYPHHSARLFFPPRWWAWTEQKTITITNLFSSKNGRQGCWCELNMNGISTTAYSKALYKTCRLKKIGMMYKNSTMC